MTALAERRTSPPGERRDALWVDVPFTKAPADPKTGDLILSGYASTWSVDRDAEVVAQDAFDKSLAAYLAKNPILLSQHNMDWPIGRVTSATKDETGLYITARVPNPGDSASDWQKGAYTSIKNGIVTTFSIGGYFKREARQGKDGPVFTITEVDLFEISCVSIPANPGAVFEAAVKALGGGGPIFSEKARDQLEQLLAVRDLSDRELLSMDAPARQERYEYLAKLFEQSYEIPAPPRDAYLQIAKAREAGVNPVVIRDAVKHLHATLTDPGSVAEEVKAGRAISAANRTRLEAALDAHGSLEEKMVEAAEAMKDAAGCHADAMGAIREVLGVKDDPVPDPDEDEYEDESPEGGKQLSRDLFARFREAGLDRFGSENPDDRTYVYVDDYDVDQGYVVYCVYGPDEETYWQVPFTRGADGSITLAAGASEVTPASGYRPKSVKALPKCPECETTITDPAKGCPNGDCDFELPGKAYEPAAYEKQEDETVQCPSCSLFNDPDAKVCDQCGFLLVGRTDVGGADGSHDGAAYEPAAYRRDADEDVQCPRCELFNDADASYCDQCGYHLSGSEDVSRTSTEPPDVKGEPEPKDEG